MCIWSAIFLSVEVDEVHTPIEKGLGDGKRRLGYVVCACKFSSCLPSCPHTLIHVGVFLR